MKHLGDLEHGARAEIIGIEGECQGGARLGALGLLPGAQVRVVHVAPLDDPITVEMQGQEISVRRADARVIMVREI